jgi:amidophosphoribosyltransferase
VHVRIASPPIKWPCFYGIDFATRAELIANGLSTDEICSSIGADSLGYISQDELVAATGVPEQRLCRACFDGVYPVALPEPELLGKYLLETDPEVARPSGPHPGGTHQSEAHPDGLPALTGGVGAADALTRP